MKEITKRLTNDLNIKKYDWLGFKITKNNPLTYHHILKNVYGDYSDKDPNYKYNNGMPLTKNGHRLLHEIEEYNIDLYVALNKLFIIEKKEGFIEEYQILTRCLLKAFNSKKGISDDRKRKR